MAAVFRFANQGELQGRAHSNEEPRIKLFLVDTDAVPVPARYREVLSTEELERANAYAFDWLKKRYLMGRFFLRQVIGTTLDLDPGGLEFERDSYGKLSICGKYVPHINLSYTGAAVLIALADYPVGVDIERINPTFVYQDIIDHYFSPEEADFISTANDPADAFFLLWTRKEAVLKAVGTGLVDDLHAVPSLQNGSICRLGTKLLSSGIWQVNSYYVATDYRISVACPISCFEVDFSVLGA